MMGETQHVYATNDTESSAREKDINVEQFSKKDVGEFNSRLLDGSESCLRNEAENGSNFTSTKDKEPQNQREAVIRPQQAGKIDFKSLHNRARFLSDGPWGTVKGSPQSPTGKSRAREKSKRSGKGERGHQQLYRLTIGNARPRPTIGIAYPQQKVTPPKKVEAGRGPISGTYRFHVPSIPEREVELQQEDLGFARCFPETTSSHIPTSFTSPTSTTCPNHHMKVQPPAGIPHENSAANGQLHYLEFQGNGNSSWPFPEKSLPGANNGFSSPKPCPLLPESSKSNVHCLGPLSFQYPFQTLHSSVTDPFQVEVHAQDYIDVSLATSQASHGAFAFHPSSRDWKEDALVSGSYDSVGPENRVYGLSPQPAQFLPHLSFYKERNEHSTDHNGAISPSGAMDQASSTFQENQGVFPPSLHVSNLPKPIGKRQSSSKDNVASQRILDPGGAVRRNMPQVSLPQVHFQNKGYGDPPASAVSPNSVPFEKSLPTPVQAHPRLLQPWEGGKKTYPPMEQSSTGYPSSAGNQLSFGCHAVAEQRQQVKKTWQQLGLTSMHSQDLIKLSRKKLPFLLGVSEWDGSSKVQKNATPGYPSKALLTGEGAIIQRHNPVPQNCTSANVFSFEGAKDAELPAVCSSRAKSIFFNVSQAVPPTSSRLSSNPALVLPPSALAASPNDSPLPSPAPNPTSSSTCSSLSPTPSSPNSHTFEDGIVLTTSPFFHHECHSKNANKPFHASETLGSSAIHYATADSFKAFHLSQDVPKDELLYKGIPVDSHFHKPDVDASKGYLEVGFEAELPPPPYSSHHLLASSLSSASLDQLDVFLTCKQCDQNFSNLSSFLEHRQFCSSHAALQGPSKGSSRGAEIRKQHQETSESAKHTPAGLGLPLPPDPHLQLLALNKAVDFTVDGEGKGEAKDDPLKVNQLNGLAANPLPLSASDLEIDDAKLDSLITEALNGLGYQSDNPEIDSSFIDVFADEELTSVKGTSGGTTYKAKESLASGKKAKPQPGLNENVKMLSCYDVHPGSDLAKRKTSEKQQGHKARGASWFPEQGGERLETQSRRELAQNKVADPAVCNRAHADASAQVKTGRKDCRRSFLPVKEVAKAMSELKQPKGVNCASSPASGSSALSAKDAKKRKLRSSTWSKELIHKIVQQKNKLHKLHTKSSKAVPLSLLADRRLPEAKDSKFGEYEYISESDDERVEYAKRYCRRKLGVRFSGRLRNSLSRRRQGRGGKEKDKEPAGRYGQRRGREEPQSQEPGRKDDCVARVRRRCGCSSTSSCQSTSLSSEMSNSPQSPERADSDTEMESEPGKRPLPAALLPRERPNTPGEEAVGKRSHQVSSELPREPCRVDSPMVQPAGFKAHQRGSPSISPAPYTNEGKGLLLTKGKTHHSDGLLGQSPALLFAVEGAELSHRCSGSNSDKPRATPKIVEQCALGMSPCWHQFAACDREALKYHAEELSGPSSIGNQSIPSDKSASYKQAGIKCLKKQKEFMAPASGFRDNPVGIEIAGKGAGALADAADTFYDCKELSNSCESSGLFPGAPAIEPPHSSNVFLCQGGMDLSLFKQKHAELAPYEANNHEQSKVSSPLRFDSSSVFGELPVAEFDASLYDGVPSSKDNYVAFECADHQLSKIISFDQQYSSFLEEKDWNLMEEVPSVLPEDIAQFHSLPIEKPVGKSYSVEINQMPLSERIADYNMTYMSGISDDELEIKRLVTELESQLQTSKLNTEASDEHQGPKQHTGTEKTETTCQFSLLTLDQEGDGKQLFLMEAEFQNASLLSTKACACENSGNEKTLLASLDSKYGSPRDPWPSPAPFSPLHQSTMHAPSATDLILVGPFSSKEDQDKLHENLKNVEISGEDDFSEMRAKSTRIIPDTCLSDVSDNLGVPSYTDHLIQSLDPLFPKTLEAAELHTPEPLPLRGDVIPELPPKGKTFDGAEELESYSQQVLCLKPEFGLQGAGGQESSGNLLSSAESIKDPEASPRPTTRSPEMLENATPFQRDEDGSALLEKDSQIVCRISALHNKAGGGKTLVFDTLTFSKKMDGDAEDVSAPREKAGNPLQQLQLFVARTAKNNEDDLLMPCFPPLHPTTHLPTSVNMQPEQEEASMGIVPSEASPTVEERKGSQAEESESMTKSSDPAELFLEPGHQAEQLGERSPCATEQLALQSPERLNLIAEEHEQHLKGECSEVVGNINLCADGITPEHSRLSPFSNSMVTSLLNEEGTRGGQVTGEVEEDQQKTTLAFRNHRKSPLSPGSSEKEMPSGALPAMLKGLVAHCTAWGEACCEDQALCTAKAHQTEEGRDQLQHRMSLAPSSPPENQDRDDYPLHGTDFCLETDPVSAGDQSLEKQASHCVEASRNGFSLEVTFADPKEVQKSDKGSATPSDFGVPPSGESLTVSEGQHTLLLACRHSSSAEKSVVGNPMQFLSITSPCGATSPLPSDMLGNMQQHFAEDTTSDSAEPENVFPMQSASSLCSGYLAAPPMQAEKSLKLQANNCRSPSMLPFKNKDVPKGLPKFPGHEDSGMCSVKDVIVSSQSMFLQGIMLDQPPSETDSAQFTNTRTNKNLKLISKPQGTKEAESFPQKDSKDRTQPGIFSKDVHVQEMTAANLPEKANVGELHPSASQFPKPAEAGPGKASQDVESRGNDSEDSGWNQNMEGHSSCIEQEESKHGNLSDDSKARQSKEKKGKGLQVTCDICSVPCRSKIGLMRHKAVKHQEKKDSTPLPDLNCTPLEKALKTSKQISQRNSRASIKERAGSSHAVGQPFPKSYRSQRKEPSRQIQEGVSKVLSGLSVTSLDITHELQSTGGPNKDTKAKSMSSEAERLDKSAPSSRTEPHEGGKGKEAGVDGLDSFARKKLKKTRKAKMVPNEITSSSRLENETPELCSTVTPSTVDLTLVLESTSASTEKQARAQSALPPHPLTVKDSEEVEESALPAKEMAGQEPPQNAGSCKEQIANPGSEGKRPMQESWARRYSKQVEEGLSNVCEELDDGTSMEEAESSKESPLKEMSCRNQNNLSISTPSPSSPQQSCHDGAAEKDFPEISEKGSNGVPCPVESKPLRKEELQPRNGSHGNDDDAAGPDLQSLFDDDSTFSQLFPRNDQFARRKCTRVYGKRTKKPKPVAETNSRLEGTPSVFTTRMASDLGETSSFCVTREDPCEYDTISIDDALTLNMCHGNKAMVCDVTSGSAKNTVLQSDDPRHREERTDLKNDGTVSLLCQRSPMEALPSLSSWGGLEKKAESISPDGTLLNPSTELTNGHSAMAGSPEPPDLEEESYDTRMNENPGSPEFQTIDVEMLSAKFEMRDVCFYGIGEDNLSCTDDKCTVGFKPMSSALQGRPIKNKLGEGKQGKNRSDLNIKAKDKQYKCKVCFQWFLTLGELDFHKLSHNPSPPPTCYMCVQRKFSSREQLRDHLKEKHAKNKAGLWACGMCLKEISDVWMYNEHLREHATQFARKGQAQKSVLGLSSCFSSDDAAVTHFLNSIMCRKSIKHAEPGSKAAPACKESKSLKEPHQGGQEVTATKDTLEIPLRIKPPIGSPKALASSPNPASKAEGAPKLAPMHPECKDPSRDCHHCGKQFPKPFKLQRHLVVHSLQKIYLCHKCPMFYQETKELRSHLSQEHGAAEEMDIKHTTLYACELCADVMHVIKKSFICSTCNYTFSKKEQYDRHMEKHLVGSSKTFRFRGGMRPRPSAKERDKKVNEEGCPREDAPTAKKKKVAHYNSLLAPCSPARSGCTCAPQLGDEPLLSPSEPLSIVANVATTPRPQTSVKTEELVGNFSSPLAEVTKNPFDCLPPPPPLAPQDETRGPELRLIAAVSVGQLVKGDSLGETLPPSVDSPDAVSLNVVSLAHKQTGAPQASEKHNEEAVAPEKVISAGKMEQAMGMWNSPYFQAEPLSKMPNLSAPDLEAPECKGSPKTQWSSYPNPHEMAPQESAPKLYLPEVTFHTFLLKDKPSPPTLNQSAKEMPSRKVTGVQTCAEIEPALHCSLGNTEETQQPPPLKDKALPEIDPSYPTDNSTSAGAKETGSIPVKPASGHLRSEAGSAQVKHNHSDLSRCPERPSANGLAKVHPKKRREHKSSHKGNSASCENIEGDRNKKKKARMPGPGRSDGVGGSKRADWPNSDAFTLSPRRRDTQCNKLSPTLKVSMAGDQLKKMVLDQCFQKKVAIRRANGDLKRKKNLLASKAFHPLLAKDPSTSLPGSLNRHRAVQGAKLPDSHNFRTAESQNNLLSQLFGQKLTSFKIPLRRDTSE
ncbi:zinc finger protein 469 [Rhineura floridana]|uniref:zinc finger protein 469 n=1 Tax=Rhineura floridana TaxID=261503 RepID=UPI002AC82794|nr:zinc finger protein 469 [Rhineura floridana]